MTDNVTGTSGISGWSYNWGGSSGVYVGKWSTEELSWIVRTTPKKDNVKYGICDDCGRTMNIEEDCVCRKNE